MCLLFQTGIFSAADSIVQTDHVAFVQSRMCPGWRGSVSGALLFALSACQLNSSLWESWKRQNQCAFMALWEAPLPPCEEGGDSIFIGNPFSLSHLSPNHLQSNSGKRNVSLCFKITCAASFWKKTAMCCFSVINFKKRYNDFYTAKYCIVFLLQRPTTY